MPTEMQLLIYPFLLQYRAITILDGHCPANMTKTSSGRSVLVMDMQLFKYAAHPITPPANAGMKMGMSA